MNNEKYSQIAIKALVPYSNNARTHSEEQVDKIAKSLQEFGFVNPVLVNEKNMIIAGHGRVLAAKKIGLETVPCVKVEGLTEAQVKAYILADNKLAEEAGWDMILVSQELNELREMDFDVNLTGFEMPELSDWFDREDKEYNERQEGNDEYNDFLEKFEPKKTTDDCYTPEQVYNAVADWVSNNYKLNRDLFMRPFYPGGDYQNENYKPETIVVDNPPFSILTEIIKFYCDKKIKFFIFAPTLTLFGSGRECSICYLPTPCSITYENGAEVNTSFITNLDNAKVRAIPELYKKVQSAADEFRKSIKKEMPKYSYPVEVITSSSIAYLTKYGENFVVYPDEVARISALDNQKDADKAIFGGGFLISEKAAAEKAAAEKAAAEKAAAEKAAAEKAAAEKAAAERWTLSDREQQIVKSLGRRNVNGTK